jgi:formylglycine-generating enzyme required for sulfatase activity
MYALGSIESNNGALTPASLLAAVNKIVQLQQKYDNFPFWIALVLQDEAGQRVVDTPWFQDMLAGYRGRYSQLRSSVQASQRPVVSGNTITVQGIRFTEIPEGVLLQGDGENGFASVQLPHPVSVPSFYMSETEVTNRLFRLFLQENSDWSPDNRAALIRQGLVDERYLESWQDTAGDSDSEALPVSNVSYHAAQAFCRWLTGKLPPVYSGFSARLPFESEWEWAARGGLVGADYPTGRPQEEERFLSSGVTGPRPANGSPRNGYGLQDMTGNLWEWCLDWYSPVKYLFTSMDAANNDFDSTEALPMGAERVIRGGSWANEQELITVSTRGSQPPEWCTPYLGFRVVLSRYLP